jgi:hypothetical protein
LIGATLAENADLTAANPSFKGMSRGRGASARARAGTVAGSGLRNPAATDLRAGKSSVFDRLVGGIHLGGDLVVAQPAPVTEKERLALPLGEAFEAPARPRRSSEGRVSAGISSNVSGLRSTSPAPLRRVRSVDEQTFEAIWKSHGIGRHGSTPLERLRHAFRVGGLERVLGFFGRVEPAQAVAVDTAGVVLVQALRTRSRRHAAAGLRPGKLVSRRVARAGIRFAHAPTSR